MIDAFISFSQFFSMTFGGILPYLAICHWYASESLIAYLKNLGKME